MKKAVLRTSGGDRENATYWEVSLSQGDNGKFVALIVDYEEEEDRQIELDYDGARRFAYLHFSESDFLKMFGA